MKKTVDDSTFMSVHAQVIFKKNVWGVIKGFIEKNTWVGCEEFYDSLKDALVAEIMPKAKSKCRKRKSTVKVYSTSRSEFCRRMTNVKLKFLKQIIDFQPSMLIHHQADEKW